MTTPIMKNVPLGDMLSVRARLMSLGWPSMAAWAKAHGYMHQSVCAAVRIWGLRSDRTPHGGISRAIVRDLRITMDDGIGPNDLQKDS